MEVYGPSQNNIFALKANNPAYYALLLTRSEYTQDEIEQVLSKMDEANVALRNLKSSAYDLLVYEDGKEMSHFYGFASDNHAKLNEMLSETDYLSPSMSQNDHANCFPVRKWQKEVDWLIKRMTKIQKSIKGM